MLDNIRTLRWYGRIKTENSNNNEWSQLKSKFNYNDEHPKLKTTNKMWIWNHIIYKAIAFLNQRTNTKS